MKAAFQTLPQAIIRFSLFLLLAAFSDIASGQAFSPSTSSCPAKSNQIIFYFDPSALQPGNSDTINPATSTCSACPNVYYYAGTNNPTFSYPDFLTLTEPGSSPLTVLLTCPNYCCCDANGVCYQSQTPGNTWVGVYPYCNPAGTCQGYLFATSNLNGGTPNVVSSTGQVYPATSMCSPCTVDVTATPLIVTSCSCNGCGYAANCASAAAITTTQAPPTPASCFSADTRVRSGTTGELRRMDELAEGEWVLSRSRERAVFTPVQAWMHRMPEQRATFHQLELEGLDEEGPQQGINSEESIRAERNKASETPLGRKLKLTAKHFIYKTTCSNTVVPEAGGVVASFEELAMIEAVYAENVQAGDCLYQLAAQGDKLVFVERRVINVTLVEERGIYAPMTANGDIVVEDVLASCHVIFNNHRAQKSYFRVVRGPARLLTWIYELLERRLYPEQPPSTLGPAKMRHPTNENAVDEVDLPFGLTHLVELLDCFFAS